MVEPAQPGVVLADVVAVPPTGEIGAELLERRHLALQAATVDGHRHPAPAGDDVRHLGLPVRQPPAGLLAREQPPHHVATRRRQPAEVCVVRRGGGVPGHQVAVAVEGVRRIGAVVVEPDQGRHDLARRELARQAVEPGVRGESADEPHLVRVQSEHPPDRVQDLVGRAHVAALLEVGVPAGADAGEPRDLLAPQSLGPPPPARLDPDLLRADPGAAGAEKVTELPDALGGAHPSAVQPVGHATQSLGQPVPARPLRRHGTPAPVRTAAAVASRPPALVPRGRRESRSS